MPLTTNPPSRLLLLPRGGGAVNANASGFGALIKTPSTIYAELEKTNTYIETLGLEIAESPNVDPNLVRAWDLFAQEWREWYGGGGVWFFGSGPSTWWGSTYDQAIDYQRRAEQFRKLFVAGGGKTSTSETATPPEPDANPENISLVKWVVAGIAIVAVAYMAGPLIRGASKAAAPKS